MTKSTNAVCDSIDDVTDVRQSMLALPFFLQSFLTWLTGKPFDGQRPLFIRANLSHLFTGYLWFISGVFISLFAFISSNWHLLPIGWLFTVSGARKLITTINHYCVHKDLLPPSLRKRFNWLHAYIADFNSAILFLQDFASYKIEHLTHHGVNVVASIVDPDMAFMWQLGFKAGMSRAKLWAVYINNLINPFSRLHRFFIIARLKVLFIGATPFRVLVQILTIALLIYVGYQTSFWAIFWAFLFPMTYLYHIASLMQFSSEHMWLLGVKEDGTLDVKGKHKELVLRSKKITNARFCGEALPNMKGRKAIIVAYLWLKWGFRMLFIHLPIRLFVLPGDLTVHDWHHRCGFGADWANGIFARAKMVQELKYGDTPFTEVWGLRNAIQMVFENLSKMTPISQKHIEKDTQGVLGM